MLCWSSASYPRGWKTVPLRVSLWALSSVFGAPTRPRVPVPDHKRLSPLFSCHASQSGISSPMLNKSGGRGYPCLASGGALNNLTIRTMSAMLCIPFRKFFSIPSSLKASMNFLNGFVPACSPSYVGSQNKEQWRPGVLGPMGNTGDPTLYRISQMPFPSLLRWWSLPPPANVSDAGGRTQDGGFPMRV